MTTATVLRGRVWKFGDNVDTDQIIPAKYAIFSLDEKKLGEHALEGVPGNEGWSQKVASGDIVVAGSNFGCGSSREIAPSASPACSMALERAPSTPILPMTWSIRSFASTHSERWFR